MGRYDKIRVYHNGQWKQPTVCRVYSAGAWQDLGANDSYNTKSLYVVKNGSYVRATLNRQDYSVVTDRWAQGSFNLLPAKGYCRCTNYSGGSYNWYFRATIRKTSDTLQQVFYCGVGTNSYIKVEWLADGRIKVTTAYGGNSNYITSSNAVGANQDVYLNVYSNKGSSVCYIIFNNVTSSGSLYYHFMFNNAVNTVGDTNMQFRGNLSAAGVDGSGNTYAVSFDTSYASGSDGSQYANVNHQESSTTGTNWI